MATPIMLVLGVLSTWTRLVMTSEPRTQQVFERSKRRRAADRLLRSKTRCMRGSDLLDFVRRAAVNTDDRSHRLPTEGRGGCRALLPGGSIFPPRQPRGTLTHIADN